MNRPFVIVIVLLVAAATASATTILILRSNQAETPQMGEEQRLTREKLFGSGNELPPIKKGQEMQPRW